jgi:transposase
MPRKRYAPEEIVAKLRQVDVLVSQSQSIADAIRQIGVSEVTPQERVNRFVTPRLRARPTNEQRHESSGTLGTF